MRHTLLSTVLVATASILAACGDDSGGTGGAGSSSSSDTTSTDASSSSGSPTSSSSSSSDSSGSSDSSSSSSGSTGGGPVTAESVAAEQCVDVQTKEAVPIDSHTDPLPSVEPGTLYEIALRPVDEPFHYVGGATVAIPEPGSYLLLILDLSNDVLADGGYVQTPEGEPDLVYAECEDCFDACQEIDSAFVYELSAETYTLGFSSDEQDHLRFVLAKVD